MTIEEFIVLFLSGRLTVRVCGDVPSPVPDSFVTVEQTGSSVENKIKSATIAVQSWALTRDQAAQLNALVESVMDELNEEPEISSCELETSYNYTDMARKKPRYQAVFDVVYSI
jgi:hypothetical protein